MRLLVWTATLLAFPLLAAAPAAAEDYSTVLIDRPLTLSPQMLELEAGASLSHDGAAVDPAPSNTEALQFSADYGILHHLQAGAVVDVAVSPSSKFTRGLVSGQYQLLEFAALRLDLGAQRIASGDLDFAFGVGVPLHLKLTDGFALVSSRPYAYGAEDDLFSFRAGSGDSITEYRLPLGILYQATPYFAIVGRSGFASQGSAQFVPLGADATVSVSRLDFGVTLDLAGQVSGTGPGYVDELTVRGFAQVRI
ncbi:MAG TPA: hypothetical protein VHW23_36685 [Kofleriaceae bacterium]|jgi:hypothetical protein|nr:hypothetical protein [Kofleriaceae bacterium]